MHLGCKIIYSGIIGYIFRYDENRHVSITPELLALLSEIYEFKGAWRTLGTLAPDRLKALRRIATIESVGLELPPLNGTLCYV